MSTPGSFRRKDPAKQFESSILARLEPLRGGFHETNRGKVKGRFGRHTEFGFDESSEHVLLRVFISSDTASPFESCTVSAPESFIQARMIEHGCEWRASPRSLKRGPPPEASFSHGGPVADIRFRPYFPLACGVRPSPSSESQSVSFERALHRHA